MYMSNGSPVKMASFLKPCQTDELPLPHTEVGPPLRDNVLESVRQSGHKCAQVRLLKGAPDLGLRHEYWRDILISNLKV